MVETNIRILAERAEARLAETHLVGVEMFDLTIESIQVTKNTILNALRSVIKPN